MYLSHQADIADPLLKHCSLPNVSHKFPQAGSPAATAAVTRCSRQQLWNLEDSVLQKPKSTEAETVS